MLKRRLIPLLIALVPPFVVLAVLLAQRSIPAAEASDLYRRYEHSEHISATFIKDFPIDDTLCVDVTLLQATDSAGWETLLSLFGIKDAPQRLNDMYAEGRDIVTLSLTPRDHPDLPMDKSNLLNNNVVATSRVHHTISIFETKTEQEIDAVLHSKYKYSINN